MSPKDRYLTLTKDRVVNPGSEDYCLVTKPFGPLTIPTIEIEIKEKQERRIVFHTKGLDPPIANALRRVMLAEVPTVAIEKVEILQNTGVLHDEIIAHRLGLIPIVCDVDQLDFPDTLDGHLHAGIAFGMRLKAKCRTGEVSVWASDLEFQALSEAQDRAFVEKPRPADGDILITRLRSGQEIDLFCHCIKGIGKDHAKFSPVATAYYRLMPYITLKKKCNKKQAKEISDSCPKQVFDVEDGKLRVTRPEDCSTCRNCLEVGGEIVNLQKIKDHHIFYVETTGSIQPELVFLQAIEILQDKCKRNRDLGNELLEKQ